MFYQQKKTYKPSYNKPRYPETEKGDYDTYSNPISDKKPHQQYFDDQSSKYKKHKRFDIENTLSADPSTHRPSEKRGYNYPAKRWGHDKYDESASPHLFFSNHSSAKIIQKKPDRQLYSVREKQNVSDEPKETFEYRKKSNKQEEYVVRPNSAKEPVVSSTTKEEISPQKEENSFIASLAALLSHNAKLASEIVANSEFKDQAVIAKGPIIDLVHTIPVPEPHVLFEICLQNDSGNQNILVWDNEESYEKFLNDICEKNHIEGKMSLYFKINLLKRIRDLQPNNKEVESLLNRLLDLNFRVFLCDMDNNEDIITHHVGAFSLINTVHL